MTMRQDMSEHLVPRPSAQDSPRRAPLINGFRSVLLLGSVLLIAPAGADAAPWKTYGEGEEQHRISEPYIISYPADFEVDPQSEWGDVPRPRDPKVKTFEHFMILHNPEHTLTVRACDYDMIWLQAEPRGIRDRLAQFDHIHTIDIKEDYILVFAEKTARHLAYAAYFAPPNSSGCVYWQSLAFVFEKGTSYADHKEVVDEMVRRFVPFFARVGERRRADARRQEEANDDAPAAPLFLTSDAAFCQSLRASKEAYAAQIRADGPDVFDIPLAILAEIPDDDDLSRSDNSEKELLALLAYESGNIPCLEYILRKGFALTDRGGQRLAEEIDERGRPDVTALFLLYEPMTEEEREQARAAIRQDAAYDREVEQLYALYLRLNQEAGGHAPVTVTPEERRRQTEPHFFNTLDLHVF